MAKIDLLKICEYFEKSDIAELEYSIADEKIILKKQAPAAVPVQSFISAPAVPAAMPTQSAPVAVAAESQSVDNGYIKVKAPLVGVYYSSPAPGEKPFVSAGDSVKKGQVLCLLEAMKMMSEVISPVDGVVKTVVCSNEDVVSFDDLLFEVEEC